MDIVSGALLSLSGFLGLAYFFKRQNNKRIKDGEKILGIYTNLLELYGYYYWVVMETVGENDPVVQEKTRKLTRMIADDLGKLKRLPYCKEIETVLFHSGFSNSEARYRAYGRLLVDFTQCIRKNYPQVALRMPQLSAGNEPELINPAAFIDWAPRNKPRRYQNHR